jgi:putative ribosome biogenesis GTPase RsgA
MQDLDRITSPDRDFHASIQFVYYVQYQLHRQLLAVSQYAAEHHVVLKGDLPIGKPNIANAEAPVRQQIMQALSLQSAPWGWHATAHEVLFAGLFVQVWTNAAWTRGCTPRSFA